MTLVLCFIMIFSACKNNSSENKETTATNSLCQITKVVVRDSFWSPKLATWQSVTVNDVFNKFEGEYKPEGPTLVHDYSELGQTRNAFTNFDRVAQGERGTGKHHGPPWYDGLIYETIRGTADLLARNPDPKMEQRVDGYIDRIVAAQASDTTGYLNTYTQLMEPDHRWGFGGGLQLWQHDVYNAGMMVEAGIHYYKATGKTKLLNAAVKYANCMYNEMGPAPKKNVVPAHSGPEEALVKLYLLFRDEPALKSKINSPVHEQNYFDLATFWIENRGHHSGLPLWKTWGHQKSEAWIKEAKYMTPEFGNHARPSWGDYAQDSISVFEQTTIEGHAVRATLLATGLTTAAIENHDPRYIKTANAYWDNMVGKRMFITGGVGAIANEEKFGSDYFLPNDAYLETCAAVGAGFFSQRMNQLTRDGKYMDEFERVIYNNLLTGISLKGDTYTYQNPLVAENHRRWGWHDCPCCPPMFLKMVSVIPDFIYAADSSGISVNLFIGSTAEITGHDKKAIGIKQETNYPWNGKTTISVDPESEMEFEVKVRVPGWAVGVENPFGLYESDSKNNVKLSVNGEAVATTPANGYITINRKWKKGDRIEYELPVQPRIVHANKDVNDLKGQVAIASGPLVYCLEKNLNAELNMIKVENGMALKLNFEPALLNGVNTISGDASPGNAAKINFKAIPYFAAGNLRPGDSYKVWLPLAD